MFNQLPITRIKITIAKILYKIVVPFIRKRIIIRKRNGINYELDLTEGIDFSVFLFGNFQKHVTKSKHLNMPRDATILDVGGNFGIMALQYAKAAEQGRVISFEPTHYAIGKFKRNLELNPDLKQRVQVINTFVSHTGTDSPEIKAYSSWKINGSAGEHHPVHLGTSKPADGVGSVTLDDFCSENQLDKINLIKIDTDGHEFEVFKGAKNAIAKYRPAIIFEVGKYVMEEKNITFTFYLDYFNDLNYKLIDSKTNKRLDAYSWEKRIPSLGTTDVIAIPE